jgi:hypothetical protein
MSNKSTKLDQFKIWDIIDMLNQGQSMLYSLYRRLAMKSLATTSYEKMLE